MLLASTALLLSTTAALAQTAPVQTAPAQTPPAAEADADASQVEAVVVTGIRASQRSSIATKREATTIVDAISANDIGALPDNSVAETLQRVVGVTGDRFKGSASELSIRGLGPFLALATINGRDISSGGGNRSVSFQQFPSELTKGVVVYKAQQADLVEGGIAGSVDLLTGQPLDYHKRRVDLSVKGQYDPYANKFVDERGLGYKISGSYIDQFETKIGDIGVMLGYYKAHSKVPEDFYTTSSSWRPCDTLANNPATSTTNCSQVAKAPTGATLASQSYLVSNTYNYRELSTDEDRESIMGTLEWRPSQDLHFIADFQTSKRDDDEGWHDLVLLDGRRGIGNATINDDGVLESYSGNSRIGAQTRQRNRFERYTGGGLAGDWTPGEWKVHGEVSYNRSHRTQDDRSAAVGTVAFVPYTIDASHNDIPGLTFTNFDPNNFAAFNSTTAANWSANSTDFKDEIKTGKLDVTRNFEDSFFTSIKAGVRYSERDHASLSASTPSNPITNQALINSAINGCNMPFEEKNWGKDAEGGVSGLRSWTTFDPVCLYSAFSGTTAAGIPVAKDPGNADVTEKTLAGYAMTSFRTEVAGMPLTGNAGVRVIQTRETVRGYTAPLHAITQPDGSIILKADTANLSPVQAKNEFTDILPSLNLSLEPREDFKVRLAIYKALARPNMEEMSAGRSFTTLSGEATSVPAALASASGGNPQLEPLKAWNYDMSFEWYPDDLTIISFAPYYKRLSAAFITSQFGSRAEPVVVDGTTYTVNIAQLTNSDEKSYLRGFEVTAQHSFKNLPGLLSGFGTQLSYSYADSNYKFADPSSVGTANPLTNFVDPAGVVGLSKNVYNATVYWQDDKLEVRAAYRFRSGYFKPLEPVGSAANRYVDDGAFLDASVKYNLTPNLELSVQASNLTNEPQIMYRPTVGSVAQVEYSGATYLAGIRFHF